MTDVPLTANLPNKRLDDYALGRQRQLIVALMLTAAVAALPLFVADVYTQNVFILTLTYVALSQSWNILGGYCGQVSLGHAIYFGIGAYSTVLCYMKFGVTPWVGMATGGVLAAVVALMLGYPCFRIAGHYYTIATIVIAEAALLLFLNWEWAGAALGLQIPYAPDSWWTFQFGRNKLPYFYFALGLALITWVLCWLIQGSRWGFWWRAVKDDVLAAQSLGVSVFRSKMSASAISAYLTAIIGGFYALFVSYIDPGSVLSFEISVLISLPAVLGGIGSLWGPALGAAILIPLSEVTRSFISGSGRGIPLIVYGGLIVLVALARPQGLVSLWRPRKR